MPLSSPWLRILAGGGFALACAGSLAQSPSTPGIVFEPPQPRVGLPVVAHVTAHMSWCEFEPFVFPWPGRVRIYLNLPNCPGDQQPPPPQWQTVAIDFPVFMEQGTYDVELYRVWGQTKAELVVPLTVGPPPDPVLWFEPAQPRPGEPVLARITLFASVCDFAPTVVQENGQLRIDLNLPGCPFAPSPPSRRFHTLDVPLGSLVTGDHAIVIFRAPIDPDPIATATLTVTGQAVAVPMASPVTWLILPLLIGWSTRRRLRTGST